MELVSLAEAGAPIAPMQSSTAGLAAAALATDAAGPPAEGSISTDDISASGSGSGSLASSSSELHLLASHHSHHLCHAGCPDPSDPQGLRTHHLLKHCLSHSQRGNAALHHFHTGDPREAAKEIARMGQRELQAKFKEVYGSATKSNNNSWLRRKLYEAVGVAPLKANTKGKARKPAASAASRKSGSAAPKEAAAKPRPPKQPAGGLNVKVKRASPSELPASPRFGTSILDMQQHSGLLSADATSDSDDGSGSHGTITLRSAPDTPRSPLGLPFSATAGSGPLVGGPMLSVQHPHARAVRQRVGNVAVNPVGPAAFVPVAEPQSPLASGLHWADGLAAATHQQQQQQQQGSASQESPFLGGGSQVQVQLPALEADLPSAFKPMDLEQDFCGPVWEAEPQPWYFGGTLDLGCLGVSFKANDEALALAMDCTSDGAAAACGDDDDEIPLLTLDLGAIDVSI